MGNQVSINKINYEDVQYGIKNNYILINTLPISEQDVLISGTIQAKTEQELFNQLLKSNIKDKYIIIYGKNCNDQSCSKKYEQLLSLGFVNVYIYLGGLFEWMLLQDIYGSEEFPTSKKELDIIKYKPPRLFNAGLLTF
jgi:CRISPR/Cas system endoribonuclease Cas6 (RAMP superfamily)